MTAFDGLTLYLVRNVEGKFFRAKGRDGHGDSWVAEASKAKVYNKIGPARATVSFFASKHPKYGIPSLLRLHVGRVEVVDENARVKKVVDKKKKSEMAALAHRKELSRKRLIEEGARLAAELELLDSMGNL